MKVAFYLESDDATRRRLAALAIAAVRRHMPGAEVLHVTSRAIPPLEGVDTCLVNVCDGGFAHRRARAHAQVPGECLFIDTDCIVRRDVSHVFRDHAFDVALPQIRDPFVRYTGGVVFTRGPAFWHWWAAGRRGEHRDVRHLLLEFQARVDGFAGTVLRLDEEVYERLASKADEVYGYAGAALVHYRGPRKRLLLEQAQVVVARHVSR